jgi:hypothetical protein
VYYEKLCTFLLRSRARLLQNTDLICKKKKSKAVPLHAMEAHGGRGGIASTHT